MKQECLSMNTSSTSSRSSNDMLELPVSLEHPTSLIASDVYAPNGQRESQLMTLCSCFSFGRFADPKGASGDGV